MNQKTKTIIKSLAFLFVFALSVLAVQTYAVFVPPSGDPLSNNIETPFNTGSSLQAATDKGIILGYLRVLGLTLIGGNLEVAGTVKIYGGTPAVDRVLVSDATGLASWRDASTLPGWGGSGPTPQGVVPVSLGGTGLTTIAANSIWVANDKDIVSTLTPGPGNSIRLNAAGTAWEQFTPLISNGNGGTINNISKFTGAHVLGDSQMTDDGTTITTGGNFKVGGNLVFSTVVPSLLSGTVNNLQLPNNTVYVQLGTVTNAPVTIHGFAPHAGGDHLHGRVVVISNNSSGNLIIKNDSNTANLTNRVHLAKDADLTLTKGEAVMFMYDQGYSGGSRWRELNHQ